MLNNYLKIALRHIKKNKGYAFINMIGLSLGMACAILILLWVNDEVQYNTFQKNYNTLYQVIENQTYEGKTYTFSALPGPFAPAIKQELPEVKYAARTDWGNKVLFSAGEKNIYEPGFFADPDFLKMFSFKIIKGDTSKMLTDPTSIVITNKMAEKFFGKDDPIGKTLKVNNEKEFTVVGLVKEPPLNSTIKFSWLAAFKIHQDRNQWLQGWNSNGIQSFVQLKEGTDPKPVNAKLKDFISKKDTSAIAKPFLLAMKDWRLRSRFEDGKYAGGRIEYVRMFSIIGLLIIIIACINFMNLATARSEQRAREVGVRKVLGAGRGILIKQFFGESIMMAFAAMIVAAVIVFLVLPSFNTLVEKKLAFDVTNPVLWAGLPLLALVCGAIAGSYPSLYLSSFNPATVFKGLRIGKNSATVYIRKGLVITQFVISIVLIISTIIIYRQIEHVKDRQLGYNKENIIYFSLKGKMNEHFPTLQQSLLSTGVVENAAMSNSRVLNVGSSSGDFAWQGKTPKSELLVSMDWVTPQYISTMGMKLSSGRDFYPGITSDSSSIIINETFAKIMGKKNAVGEIIRRDDGRGKPLKVVGVVKDFIFNDMYKKPDPLILFCDTSNVGTMLVRLKSNQNIQQQLAKVENVIKANTPGYPFESKFLDEDFNNLFKSEMLIGKLSRLFALLTILISCLGLLGLAAYTAERRTKEIGIRKVLGATVVNVITLLSKDFLRLVAISSVVAFPLAWWMMNKWLQDFAYRINISLWVFVIAGVLAVAIALFTVSFQAIKAAIANPVKSLRTE
ncbi:MAG TPA: ABC transporter permease [Chitinophagaceae bacterium]|nr:ABC transporter permease [Chitinophagaceae bacterium]